MNGFCVVKKGLRVVDDGVGVDLTKKLVVVLVVVVAVVVLLAVVVVVGPSGNSHATCLTTMENPFPVTLFEFEWNLSRFKSAISTRRMPVKPPQYLKIIRITYENTRVYVLEAACWPHWDDMIRIPLLE